jgi:type IV pilus assembly protein PilC
MTAFRYVVRDQAGKKVKGKRDAATEEVLRWQLLAENFEVEAVKEVKGFNQIELSPQRVPATEIMHFSRQVAAFVRSGISITDALEVVEDGSENKRFKKIVAEMRESIEQGVPFSDAVAEHASIFPPYYLGILRAAELTGQLDTALDQLAQYIDRDHDARHKVKSALTYPAVIMFMSLATLLVLALFVLPKFAKFFKQLGRELPLPTRMLLGVADFFKNFWFVVPICFVGLGLLIYAGKKTKAGKRIKDRLILKMPLIGEIVRLAVVERICRIVGAMAAAGVPLPEAMGAAIVASNNTVFAKGLVDVQDRMLEGEGIADPISDSGLFPRAAVQMMRVGENTGTLDLQLVNCSEYYGRELEFKLKKLTTLFEPAVILFMGGVVGFVAVALISAMYGVFSAQKTGV